jgi:hypothetical protein
MIVGIYFHSSIFINLGVQFHFFAKIWIGIAVYYFLCARATSKSCFLRLGRDFSKKKLSKNCHVSESVTEPKKGQETEGHSELHPGPQGWNLFPRGNVRLPLRLLPGVNTIYCSEEWRDDQRISPPGDNFTHRGLNLPLGDNIAPGGQSLPLGVKLRMGLWPCYVTSAANNLITQSPQSPI